MRYSNIGLLCYSAFVLPQLTALSNVCEFIQETIPTNSRILLVGERVRERVSLPSFCNFLNLQNLRLSKEVSNSDFVCNRAGKSKDVDRVDI